MKSSGATFSIEPFTPNPAQREAAAIVCGRGGKQKATCGAVNFKQGEVQKGRHGEGKAVGPAATAKSE